MKKLFIILIFALFFAIGQAQMFTLKDSTNYPFWVYLPVGYADSTQPLPLLIYLHGHSICGTDLNKVLKYGPLYEINKGMKVPFIIAAPQLTVNSSWNPDWVDEIVNFMVSHYKVDTNKVSITGLSLGGYGAFYYAGKYPEKLAAVAIMCGGGKVDDACKLKDLPIWLFHGKLDKAVPFSESTKMLVAVQNCGGYYINLTDYPNWGHKEIVRCYRMPELYEWLLGQDKSKR